MTLDELFEDLIKRLPYVEEPHAHIKAFRPSILKEHLRHIRNNCLKDPGTSARSSWSYVKEHMPKEYWDKYKDDHELRTALKEWIARFPEKG